MDAIVQTISVLDWPRFKNLLSKDRLFTLWGRMKWWCVFHRCLDTDIPRSRQQIDRKWNKDIARRCHKQDTWQWVSPSLDNKVIDACTNSRGGEKKKEERRVKEACAVARGSGRLVLQLRERGFSSATLKSNARARSLNVHIQHTQLNQPKMVQGSTLWIQGVQ